MTIIFNVFDPITNETAKAELISKTKNWVRFRYFGTDRTATVHIDGTDLIQTKK